MNNPKEMIKFKNRKSTAPTSNPRPTNPEPGSMNHQPKNGFFYDRAGNKSSTRLITFIAAIVGLMIAILSVLFESISTTDNLSLIITLLSFAAGEKSLNTFIESRYG